MAEQIKAGDSVAWKSGKGTGPLAWGLVQEVGEDGTLTISAGSYRLRVTRQPDEIARHESGPGKFHRVYPSSRR
jgi:hypothetical protein